MKALSFILGAPLLSDQFAGAGNMIAGGGW